MVKFAMLLTLVGVVFVSSLLMRFILWLDGAAPDTRGEKAGVYEAPSVQTHRRAA